MSNDATVHIPGGRASFDATGIHVTPWFTRQATQIPWTNVMFISPTPAVKKVGDDWHTFDGRHVSVAALRNGLGFYELVIALKARADLWASASLLQRSWLAASLGPHPLWAADDTPHATNGVVRLFLRRRALRREGSSLLSALDIIERFSKLDIVVWDAY